MAIRESLNKNKKLGVGVGVAILVVAVGLIAYQLLGSGQSNIPGYSDAAFYTTDNGKTFFKDDAYKVSPFDHEGKQAYLCEVFKGPDGKEFVGLIYRHNAIGKKAMEEHIAKGEDDPQGSFLLGLQMQGMDVKPAGAPDNAWRPNYDPEGMRRSVRAPGGGPATQVEP